MNQANRELKNAWKSEQRTLARSAFPLTNDLLASLFQFVEMSVDTNGCDHSRKFTEEWLTSNHVAPKPVLDWLASNGGFCDCEAVINVMQHWEENR
jgi:hypothetical protein